MEKKLSTTYILDRLMRAGAKAFTSDEFLAFFHLESNRGYKLLHRLEGRGFIKRLARGRYVVVGLGVGEVLGQPFFLGTRLVEPSYISYWSALHFYGWTEQAPRLIFVANTKRSGRRRVEAYAFRLVKLRPSRFFGYTLESQGPYEFPIAEREKAIVDSLWRPSLVGGMEEVSKCLRGAIDELKLEVLESYTLGMDARTLASRLGFLLERLGKDSKALGNNASSVYVKLDPDGPRRGRFHARWKVIDNLREAE